MTPAMTGYMAAWILFCLWAAWILARHWRTFPWADAAYWRHLFRLWKAVTFAVAGVGMVAVAPYTDDPTWDYWDAGFMSLLTYTTAPAAVGMLYRGMCREESWRRIGVAVCVWMFSASWSYDGYILWRDGVYPVTWWSNIIPSSILYWAAGCLWSLAWTRELGAHFAFQVPAWYRAGDDGGGSGGLVWFTLPFMLLAGGMILAFLVP
ncbi:MAG: hypothetical protein HQL83_00760 [Magnetococcales bacterium]|nr:hypothetical protein [Magnetococcales bacterium]